MKKTQKFWVDHKTALNLIGGKQDCSFTAHPVKPKAEEETEYVKMHKNSLVIVSLTTICNIRSFPKLEYHLKKVGD